MNLEEANRAFTNNLAVRSCGAATLRVGRIREVRISNVSLIPDVDITVVWGNPGSQSTSIVSPEMIELASVDDVPPPFEDYQQSEELGDLPYSLLSQIRQVHISWAAGTRTGVEAHSDLSVLLAAAEGIGINSTLRDILQTRLRDYRGEVDEVEKVTRGVALARGKRKMRI